MMKSNVQIRRACYGDIHNLTELLEILFGIEEDFSFDETLQRNGLKLLLHSHTCCVLVAEVNTSVVGMCTGQLTISTAEGCPAVLVEDVVVKEEWRKKGIGLQLLSWLTVWGNEQGAHRMQLLADSGNTTALTFYEKLGWQKTQLICLRKKQER